MPADLVIPYTETEELVIPTHGEMEREELDGPCVVILYNDDHHDMGEVVSQLQKATGYSIDECVAIMYKAHLNSRAIAYSGSEEACERCANILRQIRLQVETDRV